MLIFDWQSVGKNWYLTVQRKGENTVFWVYRCVLHQTKETAETIPERQTIIESNLSKNQKWKDFFTRYLPIATAIPEDDYNVYLTNKSSLPSSFSISVNQTLQSGGVALQVADFDIETRKNLEEKAFPSSPLLELEVVQLRYKHWQLYYVDTDQVGSNNSAELPGIWERVEIGLTKVPWTKQNSDEESSVEENVPPAVGP